MPLPRSYLVLHHIAKNANFGALLRTANAFGVHEVVVVGRRRIPSGPGVGSGRSVRRVSFLKLPEAEAYLRSCGCTILGVEVDAESDAIETHPFVGNTAFVLGNEGDGLIPQQRALCDAVVRIRQYGDTQSLNVNVAGAIVLHHFGASGICVGD